MRIQNSIVDFVLKHSEKGIIRYCKDLFIYFPHVSSSMTMFNFASYFNLFATEFGLSISIKIFVKYFVNFLFSLILVYVKCLDDMFSSILQSLDLFFQSGGIAAINP